MSKFSSSEKRKKRALTALCALLGVTLTAGIAAACAKTPETPEEETPSSTATDTQLLKNGNFEFHSEMDETDRLKKLNLINTPNDWSFSSGSPSSDTKSGIVDVAEWDFLSRTGHEFSSKEDAAANWSAEGVTAYDRLKFYEDYDVDSADDFALYGDYTYTLDYEDVEFLSEVGTLKLHDHDAQTEKGDTGVLMIHNRRTSDGVRGTAQYYTSGTTITLKAGTAAKVSVWVKTSNLYHYAAGADSTQDVEVTKRAGAYIGVINTVGGVTLDQMQIKNINTRNVTENNGWAQYTVYIRANTFATSTFRLVLGLGQGTSDQRYEAVDGYAFFDDVTCDILSENEYVTATSGENAVVQEKDICTADDRAEDKKFLAIDDEGKATSFAYALDLYAGDADDLGLNADTVRFGLTEEVSGSRTYTSADIDADLSDNRGSAAWEDDRESIAALMSYGDIQNSSNGYLKTIFEEDFKNYPAAFSKENIVLLMSTNGAAYTAKMSLSSFTLAENSRLLVSFFVKTGIRSGKAGAGAFVVDGSNRSAISSFDSTAVPTVDIDDERKDIYDGWVQCFFFVENNTDSDKEFRIELSLGPTSIAGASRNDFSDGYAAFANFEIKPLTSTEYSYAATGTYASKVSLTASVKDETKFDSAAASGPSLEEGLATPASYTGVQAGSNVLVDTKYDENGEVSNPNPGRDALNASGVYAGLLGADYAEKYLQGDEPWKTALKTAAGESTDADRYWLNLFGSRGESAPSPANTAYQPLVVLNTSGEAKPSYGFFAKSNATVSASSASRISVRVKLSENAEAYVYLTDVSDVEKGFDRRLSPVIPKVTYWYDDDGNIVTKDPTSKAFDADTDVAFILQSNGLYRSAAGGDTLYANLSNFERNDEGHLVTEDGTIAYFLHDGKYYAYYDESKPAAEQYTQVVENLPTTGDFVRYTAPETMPEAVLKVTGSAANAGKWITLSFYVEAGDTDKQYRLELWAGARGNTQNGIPAGGYVFFDRVRTDTSISDFSDLIGEAESALRDADPTLGQDDNLPAPLAYYYTFTFYDSADYLRYDASQDEDNLGNHWASYQQSAHAEELVWLLCEDGDGTLLGSGSPSSSCFLSYAAAEQTVTPDELGDTDDDTDDNTASTGAGVNIWLVLSSALLGIVLVAVIAILVVRGVTAKFKKKRPAKAKKPKKAKVKPVKAPERSEEEAAPEEEPSPAPVPDENDPYNE